MFFTMTMLLVCCVKIALLISFTGSMRYPEVRNRSAAATRCGVRTSPSRCGSSPISSRSSRTSDSTLCSFMSGSSWRVRRAKLSHAGRERRRAGAIMRWKRRRGGRAMGQWIELTASDGFRLAAYRADPAGPDKPRGGLVAVQEIFGVNSHIRAACDRFAADGYVTVAPALFDRYERNFDIGYTPEDIARGRELKARAGTDAALHDIAAARDAAASAGRAGLVGYSLGGFIVLMEPPRLP